MERLKQLLPELEPALLKEIEEKTQIRKVQAGDFLLTSGQTIRNTMIVLDGLVKVYREDGEGQEFFMYHIEPGTACALTFLCSITGAGSSVSAKAVVDSEVLIIPFDSMDEWMRRYRGWYQFVIRTFRGRFEELLQTIDHIAFRNMDERLEFYLKRHRDTLQTQLIPITHAEIAQELSSSREVITRLLRKLSDQGKIRLHRSAIEIVNL